MTGIIAGLMIIALGIFLIWKLTDDMKRPHWLVEEGIKLVITIGVGCIMFSIWYLLQ